MRLHTLFLSVSILFFAFFLPAQAAEKAECVQLSKTLKLGMKSDEVKLLQIFLNSDPRTKIAESGTGSAGNESRYFGNKTKIAVQKFQELYRDEVLTPAGLTRANGVFGALSRGKIAKLCVQGGMVTPIKSVATTTPKVVVPIAPKATTTTTTASSTKPSATLPPSALLTPTQENVAPFISAPKNYIVHQGELLTVYGGGFTPTNNTLFVGGVSYAGLVPTRGGALEVLLPSTAATGKFTIKFSNQKGTSNDSFIVVATPNAVPPKINFLTPNAGPIGTTVTIKGKNFSKTWNDIVVGSDTIPGIASSDGETLQFTVTLPVTDSSLPGDPAVNEGNFLQGVNADMWVYVINPSGISGPSVFTMHY